MLLDSGTRRALRASVALLTVAALAAGCGGDDSAAKDDTTTTTEGETTTTTAAPDDSTTTTGGESALPDPCTLFTTADLSAATGVEFQDGAASGTNQCAWTGPSNEAFVVTLADLSGIDPDTALEGAGSQCDDGTKQDETIDDAYAAFSCTTESAGEKVAALAVVSPDKQALIVLTGQDAAADIEAIRGALVTILQKAVAGE